MTTPPALDLIDIEELVKESAEKMLDSDAKKKADLDHPDISWDRMHVTHGETKYTDTRRSPKPTAHVLFTANFSNDTPKAQRYTLRTERRTKSTCNIALCKTYTIGASVEIKDGVLAHWRSIRATPHQWGPSREGDPRSMPQSPHMIPMRWRGPELTPPNPIIEANAGFHGEMSMEKGVNETFEQELAWSVDNEIEVPPAHVTKADLVIKEDEFDGEFTIDTMFEGKVVVTYETKKQREHVMTVVRDVKRLMTKDKGFKIDEEGRPHFITRGKCKCRFGIEQNVQLKQSEIPPPIAAEP